MTQDSFYRKGLCFSCTRCSHCCRGEPGFVYLSKADLKLLTQHLNLSEAEFTARFCRWVPYYGGSEALCLLEKRNNDCIFWNAGCTVYEARPIQCRTYPFWTHIVKDEKSWLSEAQSCPGINKGSPVSAEEIESKLHAYRMNKPLTRKAYP